MKRFFVGLAGFLALLYILNPTMGVFELLPDNLPFIGNLDEATATMVLIAALRYFGWDLTDLFSQKKGLHFGKDQH